MKLVDFSWYAIFVITSDHDFFLLPSFTSRLLFQVLSVTFQGLSIEIEYSNYNVPIEGCMIEHSQQKFVFG